MSRELFVPSLQSWLDGMLPSLQSWLDGDVADRSAKDDLVVIVQVVLDGDDVLVVIGGERSQRVVLG